MSKENKGHDDEERQPKRFVVCSWCNKRMYKKPGGGHGICPECAEKLMSEMPDQ